MGHPAALRVRVAEISFQYAVASCRGLPECGARPVTMTLPGTQVDLDYEQIWAGLHNSNVFFLNARPLVTYRVAVRDPKLHSVLSLR